MAINSQCDKVPTKDPLHYSLAPVALGEGGGGIFERKDVQFPLFVVSLKRIFFF